MKNFQIKIDETQLALIRKGLDLLDSNDLDVVTVEEADELPILRDMFGDLESDGMLNDFLL